MDGPARRALLLDAYAAALEAVDGRAAVRRTLQERPQGPLALLLAVGKAAPAMALGARDALGGGLPPGLVVTRHGYADPGLSGTRLETLEAGHPLPDGDSLEAGRRLLEYLGSAPRGAVLFLLSGGASALLEALPAGTGPDALRRLNEWLLASGLDIAAMNRVRKAVSLLKGGRLATHLDGRPVRQLVVSDVPGDDPAVIGSGPLVPDPNAGAPWPEAVPAWVREMAARVPPAPAPDDPCFDRVETRIVARNLDALEAAARRAEAAGWAVHRHERSLSGDAVEAGRRIAEGLKGGPAGLHLWGGETTVVLPESPGRGGRCQALALAAAVELAGRDDVHLLAAGTDGSDGPDGDAGALVDGGTVERGEREGFAAVERLQGADAGTFLEASGDLVQTGPTGTNVMDVVLAVKSDRGAD
ncbi:MAG TPA: DUF4147 domain-containing protein [Gammaproteobacteria bacterium]|nr:DUF4147 domain-containing protein [Gammaproteobacteria bacterium]